MKLRKHALLTAWLGLVAMWLIVLAPLVSQLVAAHQAHQPDAALCSAMQPAAAPHLSHDDAFGACGYCNLLEHHVAMPSVTVPALTLGFIVADALVATLSTRHTPFGAFPSGRPRAPPSLA